jgi:hypothetical protein
MGWCQIWTQGAKAVRDRLPLADYAAVCKAVEDYLRKQVGQVVRHTPKGGTLTAGRFRVDFILEHDATYDEGDGEEVTGNVCWVVDLYVP